MPRPPVRTHPLACKSQWDEVTTSSLDDTFETPTKKAYIPGAFSPGCARDSSDPLPPSSTSVPQTVPCPGKDSASGDGHGSPGLVISSPGSEHVESGLLVESSGSEEVARTESSSSPNQAQTPEITYLSQDVLGYIDNGKPLSTPKPNQGASEVSGQYIVSFTLQDCSHSLFDTGESADGIAAGSQSAEVTIRPDIGCVENSVGEGGAQCSVQDPLLTSVGLNAETCYQSAIPEQPQVKTVNVVPSNINKPTTTLPQSKETKTAQPQLQVTQKETRPGEHSKPALNITRHVQPGQGEQQLTHPLNQTGKPTQPGNKVAQKQVVQKKRVVEKLAPRPLMREADLEHQKAIYLHSVEQHMEGNRGLDVMTGLQGLMQQVAEQRPGLNGRPWQHPSDLSLRHYRVNQMFTVEEWQKKSNRDHQRFSKVPLLFERSSVP